MATTRKDLRGRTLRKGEMQRSSPKTRWTVWIFTLQAKQQSILCLTVI